MKSTILVGDRYEVNYYWSHASVELLFRPQNKFLGQ